MENVNSHDELKEYLFKKYHSTRIASPETSSHWKEIGGSCVSVDAEGRYDLTGWGFGCFMDNSIINRLKYAPLLYLTKYFMKKFAPSGKTTEVLKSAILKSSRLMDIDCVRQALTLEYIKKKNIKLDNKVVCVIGDGYGFLGILLKILFPTCRIVSCNLGSQLFFDLFYSEKAFPLSSRTVLKQKASAIHNDFTFIEAEQCELLADLPVDFYFNIASMQEMNPDIIEKYFNLMRASSSSEVFFYSCNRDEKKLPDGTITRHNSYPWGSSNLIINEPCPWQKNFPINRPPFWVKYDGVISHKLAQLK